MTGGMLIEMLGGKIAAEEAIELDGTAFNGTNVEEWADHLHRLGYQRYGKERCINGETGKLMEYDLFVNPCFYQRLKHMVEDKVHARSRGPVNIVTRQPVEGRARDGGLRFGEMERDCMLAHGAGQFLLDRLLYQSDAYKTFVCGTCGHFSIHNFQNGHLRCQGCSSTQADIQPVVLPYACKLLFQELAAMLVQPRMKLATVKA